MHPKLPLPRGWKGRVRSSVRIVGSVQPLTFEFFIKQIRCNWNLTVHNGACSFIFLFFFQFSFFLWAKLGLFLVFPFAFILTSLITHIYSSVIENDRSFQLRQAGSPQGYSRGRSLTKSGCTGPAILDTAYPQPNLRLLNDLGSPRSLNHGKFSEAPMPRKIPLPRGWNRRTKAAILQILALGHYAFTALDPRNR